MNAANYSDSLRDSFNIPVDESLPGMRTLLDAGHIGNVIRKQLQTAGHELTACTIEYIRYKPSTNCLATYRVTYRDDQNEVLETVLWGKAFARADFAVATDKLKSRQKRMTNILAEGIVLEGALIIIDDIANDMQLEGLQTIFDSRKLRRILYELVPDYPASQWRISHKRLTTSIIRFKPEKRAVVRIATIATNLASGEERDLIMFLRCYCDSRGENIFAVMQNLASGTAGLARACVPRPFAYLSEKRLLIVEGVNGLPLLDCLERPDGLTFLTRTAGALHELHNVKSGTLARRNRTDILADAQSAAAAIKGVLPIEVSTVNAVLKSIENGLVESASRIGFVHGDFHHDQVLFQPAKDILLDFDRSYRGDVSADVGNFCAHLRLLELEGRIKNAAAAEEQFIGGYEKCSGAAIDRTELKYWTALGILLRAIHPFRSLQPNWPEQMSKALGACRECLS